MNGLAHQKPEHLIIREYVLRLVGELGPHDWPDLREAFVPIYLEMIPPGDDVPSFELVHRHDSVADMTRKNEKNRMKLYRAVMGATYFPLVFKTPLLLAMEALKKGAGLALHKALLRNSNLFYLPIDMGDSGFVDYAKVLTEFAEANAAMVNDMSGDGVLNEASTEKELIESIEAQMSAVRHIQQNRKG